MDFVGVLVIGLAVAIAVWWFAFLLWAVDH